MGKPILDYLLASITDIPELSTYKDFLPKNKPHKEKIVKIRTEPKIGRNQPCPCGSGKKYKFCCGIKKDKK